MQSGEHGDANKHTIPCGNAISKQSDSSSHEPNISREILGNIHNVSYVYRRDVVRQNVSNKIGIVTEVCAESDSESSVSNDEDELDDESDDSDPDDEDEMEKNRNLDGSASGNSDDSDYCCCRLTADYVKVLWMDESETIESRHDVNVVDRRFSPGDYIAAVSDLTGQIGLVIDIDISVDLLAHNGSVIHDLRSKDLKRVRDFIVGDYVVLGPWLGRINDILDDVTVQLDDGSVCKVMKADPLQLKPIQKNFPEDGHFPYYPGQRVKASSSSVLKNSRWLSGIWKANQLEGTVIKVIVGLVYIDWITSAEFGPESAIAPATEQSPKYLKLLSCFAQNNWNLGDWCLLPSSLKSLPAPLQNVLPGSESHVSSKEEPEFTETGNESDVEDTTTQKLAGNSKLIQDKSVASLFQNTEISHDISPAASTSCRHFHRKEILKVAVRKEKQTETKVENFKSSFLIIKTKTRVDVAWQDGTIEQGLDSTSLIAMDSPGDHEFVTQQYVVEKASDNSNDGDDMRRLGVIKSFDAKDRTACVRWLKPVSRLEDPREFDREEVVSVYELESNPDYDFCYGDVIVRLSMGSFLPSVKDVTLHCPVESTNDQGMLHGSTNLETSDTSSGLASLSWVGNITGLKNGDIEVTWADGVVSMVGPQEIYVVGRNDVESDSDESDSDDEVASGETVENDNMETVDANEEGGPDDASDVKPEVEEYIKAENSGSHVTLGLMGILASVIFSRGRKHSDSFNSDTKGENNPDRGSNPQNTNVVEYQLSKLHIDHKEEEIVKISGSLEKLEALNSAKLPESDSPCPCQKHSLTFKGFDIVRDTIDNYYIGARGQNSASRKWLKKVQQDWSILKNNLPDGIYVRAYEDRMDLLRAVIVGAYGTPYQDGLFFFDFHLPPEYPNVPPSAYYHSGGWRINPNLYEEGKVCLSLLNTWSGKGNELWDASSSSILQVLVSLQGLVLNSKPYFNEAGYDKQIGTGEGEKHSFSYNENTFLLNCKTMMYLMRKSPKDFEELVIEHFKERGYHIMKACDAYMKGHIIGSLAKDASVITSYTSAKSNSVGFKIMLAKLIPKLFSALTEIGAECQEFRHLIEPEV